MKTIALMPLKAHSSRVPGKNFRDFNGKPLFRWTLEALLKVPRIDLVIINTDARRELAGAGFEESERVILRSRKPEICGDEVSMNLVLADDVANTDGDVYLMTHTTNPLISPRTIQDGLNRFLEGLETGACDSAFSVNRIQTRFYRGDGTPVNHDPENLIPTQDLEPWFEENSNLYLFTRESFRKTSARIGGRPMLFVTPPMESCDIDTPEDWELTEAIAPHVLRLRSKESEIFVDK